MRRKVKKQKIKYVQNCIAGMIILMTVWGISNFYLENKIENGKENENENYIYEQEQKQKENQMALEENMIEKQNLVELETVEKPKVITEYKGYPVTAKLEIAKIHLETYVLSSFNEKALLISPTKFWGGDPNTVGNFCISAHNYINQNMFHNLKKLAIQDEIILTDNINGSVVYQVYDIYKVDPKQTECVSQNTNGNREVTLITCTSDSKKRIIVKAREKTI